MENFIFYSVLIPEQMTDYGMYPGHQRCNDCYHESFFSVP